MQADSTAYQCTPQPGASAMMALLAPYHCKVIFPTGEWGLFGRGSLDLAKSAVVFGDTDRSQPSIVVGSFCEMSGGCQILLGGEHRNNQIINAAFGVFPKLKQHFNSCTGTSATTSCGPVMIGNNVTFSQGATVLSGTTIADGAVIGAHALVRQNVPAFTIVAGVPARVVSQRCSAQQAKEMQQLRWWDWPLGYLHKSLPKMANLSFEQLSTLVPPQNLTTEQNTDYVVLSRERGGDGAIYQCVGIERNREHIPIARLSPEARDYLAQMQAPAGTSIIVRHDLMQLVN